MKTAGWISTGRRVELSDQLLWSLKVALTWRLTYLEVVIWNMKRAMRRVFASASNLVVTWFWDVLPWFDMICRQPMLLRGSFMIILSLVWFCAMLRATQPKDFHFDQCLPCSGPEVWTWMTWILSVHRVGQSHSRKLQRKKWKKCPESCKQPGAFAETTIMLEQMRKVIVGILIFWFWWSVESFSVVSFVQVAKFALGHWVFWWKTFQSVLGTS